MDRLAEELRAERARSARERARSARLEACIRKRLPPDVAAMELAAAAAAEGTNSSLDRLERKVAKRKKKRRQQKRQRSARGSCTPTLKHTFQQYRSCATRKTF